MKQFLVLFVVSPLGVLSARGCVFVPLPCGNLQESGQERQLDQGNVNEVFHLTVPVIPHHVSDRGAHSRDRYSWALPSCESI